MRRLFGALILCSSLALVAVAPAPAPTPAPKASARSSAAPSASPAHALPTILVYPFDVQTGADPKLGIAIAQIIAQEMTQAGELNMLPVPNNVARPTFLAYARGQHADFYISGYVTAVGLTAAVVEQVVSVDSGVILFSQTAQVSSVQDVASQSLQARAQILAFLGRNTQTLTTQSAQTPAPTSSNGANMKLGGLSGIVDSVFHRRGAPTPSPTPGVKPQRGVIVSPVAASGTIAPADLKNASNELYFSMGRHFTTQLISIASNVAQTADSICGTHRDNTIATGTIAETIPKRGRPQVVFTLQVYTCFGAVLASETGKGDSINAAVDAATTAYASEHPDNS